MRRAYTQLWPEALCEITAQLGGRPLRHTAGNAFIERGVEAGDRVYVVTVQKGVLVLLGRLDVERIVDERQAAGVLDYRPGNSPDHVLARTCTVLRFDRRVPRDVATSLHFDEADGAVPLRFKSVGLVDEEDLLGVRRLTPESAAALETLLDGEQIFTFDLPEGDDDEEESDDEAAVGIGPLVEYFKSRGYTFDLVDDEALVSQFVVGDEAFDVLVHVVGPSIAITVTVPLKIADNRRHLLAEAVARANALSFAPPFIMQFDEGVVSCRSITLNDLGLLDSDTIGIVFELTLFRAMTYRPAFRAVAEGAKSPRDAVAEAEASLSATDEGDDDDDDFDDLEEDD